MSFHKALTGVDIHVPHALTYADALARWTATGLVAADVGKLAAQADSGALYRLRSVSPVLWSVVTVNRQGTMEYFEEFVGNALSGAWDVTLVGAGSSALLISAQDSAVRLRADVALNDSAEIDHGGNHSFRASSNAAFWARFEEQGATNQGLELGFSRNDGASEHIWLEHGSGGNYIASVMSATTETTVDTGVAVDTSKHIVEILVDTTRVEFIVDDVSVAVITTNIPTNTQQIHARIENLSAGSQRDLEVDAIRGMAIR